jgi:dipeptidase E
MKNMIVASTSTLYGSSFLEYLTPVLTKRLKQARVDRILFIPYARPGGVSHDEYTLKAQKFFSTLDVQVNGLHATKNPATEIQNAQAIFTGGGNTFLLVKKLQELQLLEPLRKAIHAGTFYLGTSAGSNICGLNMRTTNDMPIVQPASFKTTGVLSYNINAHYQDTMQGDRHMGETRAQRIEEFLVHNQIPVVGLREGSYINVQDGQEILEGEHTARLFQPDQPAIELLPGHDLAGINK